MTERHTKGTLQYGAVEPAPAGSRSAMARASDVRPFKPYVYGGETEEPPAVTAARERYRAHEAQLAALDAEQDARAAGQETSDG